MPEENLYARNQSICMLLRYSWWTQGATQEAQVQPCEAQVQPCEAQVQPCEAQVQLCEGQVQLWYPWYGEWFGLPLPSSICFCGSSGAGAWAWLTLRPRCNKTRDIQWTHFYPERHQNSQKQYMPSCYCVNKLASYYSSDVPHKQCRTRRFNVKVYRLNQKIVCVFVLEHWQQSTLYVDSTFKLWQEISSKQCQCDVNFLSSDFRDFTIHVPCFFQRCSSLNLQQLLLHFRQLQLK